MQMQIKSKKLNKTITFSRPGSAYIFADLNGQPGSTGVQICSGGHLTGSTISYCDENQAEFDVICRRWYRAYIREVG